MITPSDMKVLIDCALSLVSLSAASLVVQLAILASISLLNNKQDDKMK
jgi:hypothetical protein